VTVSSPPEPRPAKRALRPTLAIVGAGRAGTVLALGAHAAGYRITAVASRTPASSLRLAEQVGAVAVPGVGDAVRRAELCLLTVPDGCITGLAARLAAGGVALRGRSLVHCSGALGLSALAAARLQGATVGAFHPLQALSIGADPAAALRGTYVALEADPGLRPLLEQLAGDLGAIAFTAPSANRALYHAAAVLAGNAPLALLHRATELLVAAGVAADIAGPALAALLEGAAANARWLGAREALTGPVVRNDAATVAGHLAALRGDPATQRLYARLAREMLRSVGATGREAVAELLTAPAPQRAEEHAPTIAGAVRAGRTRAAAARHRPPRVGRRVASA